MKQIPDSIRQKIGDKLAMLWFAKGVKKWEAILRVFPHMSEENARANAFNIFKRYKVADRVLEMFDSEIGDTLVDQLVNFIKDNVLETKDVSVAMALLDRVAKLKGRFTDKLEVAQSTVEDDEEKARKARLVLERSGIDPDSLDLS